MGYCICLEDGNIKIKKENMKLALKKLSDFFEKDDLRWVNGFSINDSKCLDLREIWNDLRYDYEETNTHYIINEFLGEKLGDDVKLFELISEYCEDGYLQFVGEDGEHFRIIIKNKKVIEKWAEIRW